MGLAQTLALVPGTSRSGITITAARALGFGRVDAARLSMLMSIPAIGAAGGWLLVKLAASGDLALGADAALAAALAFVSALLALWGLMRMLRTWTMTPFVLYRFALGAALLWFAYG
jgi:undecaprenyl-diphosphatase